MTAILHLALVLVAITGRTELLNEKIQIPRSQWRALKVEVRERPATVEVDFQVLTGRSGVRVVFMTDENAERFEKGQSYEALRQTDYQKRGKVQYFVGNPGAYRILLDNRLEGREPAEAQVKVTLLHHHDASFVPKELGAGRRRSVVGISLGMFALLSLLIGRKLHAAGILKA
jgi:hypothetical protein